MDSYEVLALRYASRMTSRAQVFLNYHLYDEPDAPMQMDYYVWVVRNHVRTIVVDTGYGELGGRNRGRGHLVHPTQLLWQAGIDAADVGLLPITHAHYDHIGNLTSFPAARIQMARSERDFWRGPTANRFMFRHACEATELAELEKADVEGRVEVFEGRTEIAPGIEMIEVGGHTHGQSILTVPTDEGLVVLASDAAHYYEEIERDRPFSIVDDLDRMYRGFDLLRSLAESRQAIVLPGHDPDVMHRHRPLDGELAGHGIVIGNSSKGATS